MSWTTPSLSDLRRQVRDQIAAWLPGADATVPNSNMRVLADAQAGLGHLALQYLAWVAKELLPDTATEWLPRHGEIWGKPRLAAVAATGIVSLSGAAGLIVPVGTQLSSPLGIDFETLEDVTLASGATEVAVRALDPGTGGNLPAAGALALTSALPGVDATATIVSLAGGADQEAIEALRERILARIRMPPQGGAEHDYVAWVRDSSGAVTRAWARQEAGMGTVTVRFAMDVARPPFGIPSEQDIEAVRSALDPLRPVTVRDLFIVAPIPKPLTLTVRNIERDSASRRARIEAELATMIVRRAAPGQTIYRSWVDDAIAGALDGGRYDLTFENTAMDSAGHLAVLGSVIYA